MPLRRDGGFWVVEVEPQVRALLGLDGDSTAPAALYPEGRAGRQGIDAAVIGPFLDATPWYCTLGVV